MKTPLLFLALPLFFAAGCASAPVKKEVSKEERAKLMIDVAYGSIAEGDGTGALQTLIDAQKFAPTSPELHHAKAIAYTLKGDPENAIEEARLAVQLKPDYSEGNNTLGKLLLDAKKYDEATRYLSKSAADPLFRDAYKSWTSLGILHYRRGDYAKSKEALNRAIMSSREQSCIAYYYRGHIALREQRVPDAIHDYKQATKGFCSSFADAHVALGMTYENAGKVDEARRVFLDIQQSFPSTEASAKAIERLRKLR